MQYIMSLDQGTTSSRCILFDKSGNICSVVNKEFRQIFPQPGWVEHDANEIWDTTYEVAHAAMAKLNVKASDIAAIGITNQRETTIVWDKETGEPIANAIVWQCRRTSDIIDQLVKDGHADIIRQKTGLIPDAYFSGSKIQWLLDNVPGARRRAAAGKLLFGTVDTWLIWKLTGGRVHVTDYTNASRTMLFNIHTLQWDEDLLKLLNVPASMLPEVKPSSYLYGKTDFEMFGGEIPIAGAAGDQQCALFGQCCFEPGTMKNTYGTGCFLLMNTGKTPVESKNGLVTTIAASTSDKVDYALEGSIFIAGAAIQWLRDELGVITSAKESAEFAAKVPDTAGGYVVPAFTGLGAPFWSQRARAMERDSGIPIAELKVDGGASANNFLMQFQSDLLGADVYRPRCIETTGLGAAYLAGLAVGYWANLDDVRANWAIDITFHPQMNEQYRKALIKGWDKAVKCALLWGEE